MAQVVKGLVLGSMFGGVVITGNYYYVHRTWKSDHPLVSESMDMLKKDEQIVKHLGPYFDLRSSVSGILESGKTWANINFEVAGPTGRGKVSLLADAKMPSELTTPDEFPLKGSAPSYTFLDYLSYYVAGGKIESESPQWRILALHFKPDETTSIPVIADGVRSHKEARTAIGITPAPAEEAVNSAVASRQRRERTYRMAQKRWFYMAGFCSIGLIGFLLARRYMRVHPVANSVFMNQALEIISTDVWVRGHLGVPIRNLQFVKGSLNYNFTKGQCETLVYGPKNYGKLEAKGSFDKAAGKWKFALIRVNIEENLRSLVEEKPT